MRLFLFPYLTNSYEKKIIILVLLCFSIASKSQIMSDLYNIVISDCYVKYHDVASIDSMYITDFSSCQDRYFNYKLNLSNKKIVWGVPNVNKKDSSVLVYKLNYPEIEKKNILISLGIYSLQYINNERKIIFQGTLSYEFEYSRKKKKYVLVKQIDAGL